MGGTHVPEQGPNDDGYDEDGYDESQRAEILEATRDGPSDGNLLTDLNPDLGGDVEDEPIDELDMEDGEVGETDDTVRCRRRRPDRWRGRSATPLTRLAAAGWCVTM